jgi:putative nucleotide binding protein
MDTIRRSVKEEHAIVLDFLMNGHPFDSRPAYKKTPIAQAIGIEHFILLELVPKKGIFLQPYEKVYTGEGKREKIHHIFGKVDYSKLTETAKSELDHVVKDMVESNPNRFLAFFNKAGPINVRRHQLELLPGVGKKHMMELLEQRKEKPFDDFDDIRKRVKLLPDPLKVVIRRIISELKGEDKHKLFVGV